MPNQQRPLNVLWLMTDEQRADSLGLYGSHWAVSPHLDDLARGAMVFRHAYTPSPVCMPARLSILSGQHPCETGVWLNEGSPGVMFESLLEPFHEAGYASATFGKQHYGGRDRAFGTEKSLVISEAVSPYDYAPPHRREDYGAIKHTDKWILGGTFPVDIEERRERQAVRAALQWLDELQDDTPFLLRLSFSAPHTPVVPPAPFDTMIPESAIDLPPEADRLIGEAPKWLTKQLDVRGSHLLKPEEIGPMRRFYYGETAFVDHAFGLLLEAMRQKGLLENTVIAFLSDHGTHLGDQGLVQKGTFFDASARVPFFVRLPSADPRSGRYVETPVSTISLLPTLLDIAGLPVPERVRELSLADVVRGHGSAPARPVFSEIGSEIYAGSGEKEDHRLVMVRDGDYKLMLNADVPTSGGVLVNVAEDPHETRNLYHSAEHRSIRDRLVRVVEEHLAGTGPIKVFAKELDELRIDDQGRVLCTTCRSAMSREVPVGSGWCEGFARAFACQHCGQRFGIAL